MFTQVHKYNVTYINTVKEAGINRGGTQKKMVWNNVRNVGLKHFRVFPMNVSVRDAQIISKHVHKLRVQCEKKKVFVFLKK